MSTADIYPPAFNPDPLAPKTPFDRLIGLTVHDTMNVSTLAQDVSEGEAAPESTVIPQKPLDSQPEPSATDPVPWLTPEVQARQAVWLEKTLMDLCPPDKFDEIANDPIKAREWQNYWNIHLTMEPDGWTLWKGDERVSRLEITAVAVEEKKDEPNSTDL